MTTRVKICGITRYDDAAAAVDAGADALGLNFWPGSKRHVDLAAAESILPAVPAGVLAVGVFVNAARAEIERALERLPLGAIQLHGDETPEECRGWPVPVIKALRAGDDVAARAAAYSAVEFLLVDADVAGRFGGTGERFPWRLASTLDRSRLFVAGGLDPENVADAVRALRPYAVDVAGGVESEPGKKDPRKVKEFVDHAKHA